MQHKGKYFMLHLGESIETEIQLSFAVQCGTVKHKNVFKVIST